MLLSKRPKGNLTYSNEGFNQKEIAAQIILSHVTTWGCDTVNHLLTRPFDQRVG